MRCCQAFSELQTTLKDEILKITPKNKAALSAASPSSVSLDLYNFPILNL